MFLSDHFICLFVILCSLGSLDGGYVVTTPRRWTSGEASQVCVTLTTPATAEDQVRISLKEQTSNRPNVEDISTAAVILDPVQITVPEGETHTCSDVSLPKTVNGNADIHVNGFLSGSTLNFTKPITIATDVGETFVQTDKYLYKPNQDVQFRILTVVGPYLRVSTEQYDEIWVENPSGTRIAQWLDVPNENGLIHMSFTLSDEPEEGTYNIKVRTPNQEIKSKSFKVEEYVLPKYEVKVKKPAYVLGTSESVVFRVCAKYTFGQPVKGNVTLTVDNNGWGTHKIEIKKEAKISGCHKFPLNTSELAINGDGYFAFNLNAHALVQEEGTGAELKSNKVSVDITRTALDFEDIGVQKFLKPEVPYVGEVRVTFPDESPAVDEPMSVCGGKSCKNFTTNADGVLKYVVPPHMGTHIRIKALNYPRKKSSNSWRSIMYESSFSKTIKRYHSPSNSSLVIASTPGDIECSSSLETIDFQLPIQFSVVGLESATVSVQVISRGQIQFTKVFDQPLVAGSSLHLDESLFLEPMKEPVTKGAVRGQFSVPVILPKTVSPKAKVIVWYARPDGEVVSDARQIDITECLLNSVDLKWSVPEAQPGDAATLSIEAEPLSLCSLGVVDKSVQLLSSKKNSLTVSSLLDIADASSVSSHENLQVNDYEYCKGKYEDDPTEPTPPLLPPVPLPLEKRKKREASNFEAESSGREKRSFMPYWPFYSEDVDALHMFDEAGVYVLSDQTLESRPCNRRYAVYRKFGPPGPPGANGAGVLFAAPLPQAAPFPQASPPGQPGLVAFDGFQPLSATGAGVEEKRTYFPETWIWSLLSSPSNGVTEEVLTLPDSVTEWVGNAVCVHPTKGVGISPPSSITAFRDFFADLTLPPSVKRGEIFPVKISVFNYLKESLPLTVVLEESPEYDILSDTSDEPGSGTRSSCLPAQDKDVHQIRIRPKEIGDVNITVRAFVDLNSISSCEFSSGKIRTDILVKPIRVELEGFPKEEVWSQYVCSQDLVKDPSVLESWIIESPASIVPDSARGFLAVVGDLMGPTLDNLGSLIKMPYGCGEQNMLNFAPNIFVMQYLDASNQNNEETAQKSISFMKKGYQRELNYRHRDGSFSAFGEGDDSGSTWLTAFVLKSFAQARPYINVDADDLTMSRDWLRMKQLENGCFESVGKVLHKGMKGGLKGSDSPSLLSSFVLISLIEAGELPSSDTVREALFCLQADPPTRNPYSLAVKAYALSLADSADAQSVIDNLLTVATRDTSVLYWELPKEYESSKGVGVETAGYAVLALLAQTGKSPELDYVEDVRKIVKWMNNQRNGQGGFVSTQDTIVALQALAEFEKSTPQEETNFTIATETEGFDVSFSVNERNKLLQQSETIPYFPITLSFAFTGGGCGLIQAVLRYNVPDDEPNEAFSLRIETTTVPDQGCKTKNIEVCAAYLLEDLNSNMAIIEVKLVSGFIPVKADLKQIVSYGTGLFKRYEVDGNLVTIYVDEFSPEEICASFNIIREVDVEEPKPGSVKVYDYYKPEYSVSQKYILPPATECLDINVVPLPFEDEIVVTEETTTSTADLGEMLEAFDEAIP